MRRLLRILMCAILPATAAEAPRWSNPALLGTPGPAPLYRTARVHPQVEAEFLVGVWPEPGTDRLWYLQQTGSWGGNMRVFAFRGAEAPELLWDSPDQLYGIAFHPDFARNGHVYLGGNGPWELKDGETRHSRVWRLTVRNGRLDPDSRVEIIAWPSDGHNGGDLCFGADGMLFVTSGDGTSAGDAELSGQDTRSLRAKVLRIDVDKPASGKAYGIPADNPFAQDARFAPETYAYGLRNPWRITFDRASGQLWVGENGQDHMESARLIRPGENHGWSLFEGSRPFRPERALGPHPPTLPTLEHNHAEFRSLTGGVVYRGARFPELVGAYVYGDFNTGRIWSARHADGRLSDWKELCDTPLAVTHVTAGHDGELLIADYYRGGLHTLERVPPAAQPPPPFPRTLAETGIFQDAAARMPAVGMNPYRIHAPQWMDEATATRWFALPPGGVAEEDKDGVWSLPTGSVAVQEVVLEIEPGVSRRLETRLLVRVDGDWNAYTYLWHEDQTGAALVEPEGRNLPVTVRGQKRSWRVPSRAECLMCHTLSAGFLLGLNTPQVNRDGQLERWTADGLLVRSKKPYWGKPMVNPADPAAPLDARARSYLAANCSHCHRPGGGGNADFGVMWGYPPDKLKLIDAKPAHYDFGLPNARLVAAGSPERSVLLQRVGTTHHGRMPPLCTSVPDAGAIQLLTEWIRQVRPPPLRAELKDALRSRDGTERFPVTLVFDPDAPPDRRVARLEARHLHAKPAEIPVRPTPRGPDARSLAFSIQAEAAHANRVSGRFDVVLELRRQAGGWTGTYWGTFHETAGGKDKEGGLSYESAGELLFPR